MIPAFDGRGLLPAFLGADETTASRSPYHATMSELIGSAVGNSPIRENLAFGLLQYRELLHGSGYVDGMQFVDGSFVENVELLENRDPGDIDVFSFLNRPAIYQHDPAQWQNVGFTVWTGELMDRDKNKARFGVDTYGVAVDQHGPLMLIRETIYWYSLFSHRRVTHAWKGFLAIPLNQSDDVAARKLITGN